MNPAEYDHLGLCLTGILTQFKWVSNEISHILYFASLVAVSEHNSAPLAFEAQNFFSKFGTIFDQSSALLVTLHVVTFPDSMLRYLSNRFFTAPALRRLSRVPVRVTSPRLTLL